MLHICEATPNPSFATKDAKHVRVLPHDGHLHLVIDRRTDEESITHFRIFYCPYCGLDINGNPPVTAASHAGDDGQQTGPQDTNTPDPALTPSDEGSIERL